MICNWPLSPAFAVVPIFGLANAGVSRAGTSMENLVDPVPLGVALGLQVGKQVGIFLLAAPAIRMGLAKLPEGCNRAQLYGVALLCGIHNELVHRQPGVCRIGSPDGRSQGWGC